MRPRVARFEPHRARGIRRTTGIIHGMVHQRFSTGRLASWPVGFVPAEQFEPAPMPLEQGVRFDNQQGAFPIRQAARQHDEPARPNDGKAGYLTCRSRTMSCWRRSAFSATSSGLVRSQSAATPSSRVQVAGLVQRLNRSSAFSTTWRRADQRRPRRGSDIIGSILLQRDRMSDQRQIMAARTA